MNTMENWMDTVPFMSDRTMVQETATLPMGSFGYLRVGDEYLEELDPSRTPGDFLRGNMLASWEWAYLDRNGHTLICSPGEENWEDHALTPVWELYLHRVYQGEGSRGLISLHYKDLYSLPEAFDQMNKATNMGWKSLGRMGESCEPMELFQRFSPGKGSFFSEKPLIKNPKIWIYFSLIDHGRSEDFAPVLWKGDKITQEDFLKD